MASDAGSRFHEKIGEVQTYLTLGQLVLIGILQGVAVGVLASGPLKAAVDGALEGNESLNYAYISLTFAAIAVVTYLYLVQILLYSWPFPFLHFLIWSLLAGAEFVMVVSIDEPHIWFWAIAAAGAIGVIVHLFNVFQFKGQRKAKVREFHSLSEEEKETKIQSVLNIICQLEIMERFQYPFLFLFLLVALAGAIGGVFLLWCESCDDDIIRWSGFGVGVFLLTLLAVNGNQYYKELYQAIKRHSDKGNAAS